MLSKQSFNDRHYGLILVSLIVQHFGITALHLLPMSTMCSPYRYTFISSWDYTECMQTFLIKICLSSLSHPLSAVTTDNGCIFAILFIIGLMSMLSYLARARLILIVHTICCSTSAPVDNLAYFLLVAVRSV